MTNKLPFFWGGNLRNDHELFPNPYESEPAGIAYFDEFEIELTEEQARSACHPGDCYQDAATLADQIRDQLNKIGNTQIRAELERYGAWNSTELAVASQNHIRITWLAACQIREETESKS